MVSPNEKMPISEGVSKVQASSSLIGENDSSSVARDGGDNVSLRQAESMVFSSKVVFQMPISARMSNVQPPSQVIGQNGSSSGGRDERDNVSLRQAESLFFSSKKLEDDIKLLGKKILQHEENIKYLKNVKSSLANKIADMQAALAKHHSSRTHTSEEKILSQKRSLNETIERIKQHEKSAASVFCHLTQDVAEMSSTRNVLGVLATLGKVDDINLSRLLSEYLGLDIMLALVCKSNECIEFLESYDKEGAINKNSGLYRLGSCIGKIIDGRFNVICLEDMRPYVGEFTPDDPQRRLALMEPKLPNGESPEGFLGFAVNMIHIDSENLFFVRDDGYGLRETLFYYLFARLQVYRTRTDMMEALPCIPDGAISLDGGIIRSPSMFSFGTRKEIDVHFPIYSGDSFLSKDYTEIKNQMKELIWKSDNTKEDIRREETLLALEKFKFERKKKDFLKLMAQSLLNPMKQPVEATKGDSTPKHVPAKTDETK